MQDLITRNREQIEELCRTHHVRALSVFGSAVRDDFNPERSDVDFLVEFEGVDLLGYAKNFFDLIDGLETLLARKVDLITDGKIRNPYLREEIERDRQLFYAA